MNLSEELQRQQTEMKLGSVTSLRDDKTAVIRFDEDTEPSGKSYSYLNSYVPKQGDRVLLAPIGNTYIILGAILFNESPQGGGGGISRDEVEDMINKHYPDRLVSGSDSVVLSSNLLSSNNKMNLGTSSLPFGNFYATGTVIVGGSPSQISFYGRTPVSRQKVAKCSTSGTLANAITALNNINTALVNLGLISN